MIYPDAIMPIFIYEEYYGHDLKCIDPRTEFEAEENENGGRWVAKVKPYILGWLKCVDEVRAEVFSDNITLGINVRAIR